MKINRKWKIYVIQHSHTDIGYTERQEKIVRYHCDFVKQAIAILNQLHLGVKKEYEGFVWQCENYWQVQNFYAHASGEDIRDFEKYVRSGEIGLSGTYLNMTELISKEVLDCRHRQAQEYGGRIGVPVRSGMTADINGFGWGYADSLYENGITRLFSCLHPHHGMFPLYRKVCPFYWESPKGNRLLVWNGEYYQMGNELFLSPYAGTSYLIYDEYNRPILDHMILKTSREDTLRMEHQIAKVRIDRYLENLEQEKYPYDLVPFMVSGTITDNAPPSGLIPERLRWLNEEYQGQVHFEMATLDQFFEQVEKNCEDIPVHRGDWNDWWADGVGSTPAATKIFCDARRKYHICRKLDGENQSGSAVMMDRAAEELTLYAEHTWGFHSSVAAPWETMTTDLEMRKSAYAVNAATEVYRNLDQILAARGEISISRIRSNRYKIINPHDRDLKTTVKLYMECWEYMDGVRYSQDLPVRAVDELTGETLLSQLVHSAHGITVEVLAELNAKSERTVKLWLDENKPYAVKNHAHIGAEGVQDLLIPGTPRADIECMETEFYRVCLDEKTGIRSITDKKDGRDLLLSRVPYPAFCGIYEVTEAANDPLTVRRKMGRNRKSPATKRYQADCKKTEIVENGDIYAAARLDYELPGTGYYSVLLKVYKCIPRLEATVRIHKLSTWNPENLYIALPFTAGEDEEKYIDKTGCVMRPGIDQLPGTNMEFYLCQNGFALMGKEKTVTVAVKDAPLLTFGELKAHPIRLCDGNQTAYNHAETYSWVMNNYWETNFKAELGGFYEFTYTVSTHGQMTPEEALKCCEEDNEGILGFYTK